MGSPLLRTVHRINNNPMPYTKSKAPMTAIVDFNKATLQKSLSKWLLLGHFVLVKSPLFCDLVARQLTDMTAKL